MPCKVEALAFLIDSDDPHGNEWTRQMSGASLSQGAFVRDFIGRLKQRQLRILRTDLYSLSICCLKRKRQILGRRKGGVQIALRLGQLLPPNRRFWLGVMLCQTTSPAWIQGTERLCNNAELESHVLPLESHLHARPRQHTRLRCPDCSRSLTLPVALS